ncbi:MAG: hypothetical protein ACRDF6_03810 [bacterium]
MDPITGIVIVGAVVLAAWFWLRRRDASRQAEAQLRRICLGDDAQAERLISNERARAPGISRAEAASRAVGRYQRDNR